MEKRERTTGFEPATPTLARLCATSCATSAFVKAPGLGAVTGRASKTVVHLSTILVRDTGIEPVTSSVSGKRSPAELIARDPPRRWRRESNPCARLCRPLPHHSATPPLGLMPLHLLRADDGIRTRDPHLGKVMRYQLRYIRAPRTTRRPSRRTTIVHQSVAAQISTILAPGEVRTADTPAVKSRTR